MSEYIVLRKSLKIIIRELEIRTYVDIEFSVCGTFLE